MSNVKFSYHHVHFDGYEDSHVLTLARRVQGNAVTFGWSICFPGKWVPFEGYVSKMERDNEVTAKLYSEQLDKLDASLKVGEKANWPKQVTLYHGRTRYARVKGLRLEKGDLFSKAKGRELALKRLNESPACLERKEGEHAIDAILRYLSRIETHLDGHGLLMDIAKEARDVRKAQTTAKVKLESIAHTGLPSTPPSRKWTWWDSVKQFFSGEDWQ